MFQEPVTAQPITASSILKDGLDYSAYGQIITVRNMTDTPDDCTFAGKVLVEAFRSKMVHATSERSLPTVADCKGKFHRGQAPVFYQRQFIAEYHGQKAGLLGLKFHTDPKERVGDAFDTLECCDGIGMGCLGLTLDTDSSKIPRDHCYLDHICVDAAYRGKGIGKVLMQTAESEARKESRRVIYLYVSTSNRAKNLYEREGYRVTSTETCCGCGLLCTTGERSFYRMEKTL